MKKFVIPMMMLASLTTFAGEKGNGGETVDVNGVPRLRDLVETTTCNWVDGAGIVRENDLVNTILNRVSALDWYFAEDLRQELLSLDFCLTSRLVRVDTRDLESFVTVYNTKTTQAAIRFNKSVYVDAENFMMMPADDRAFLIIHEAMHSYLPSTNLMRNQGVRSMVRSIEAVYLGRIASAKSLHLQMENNGVEFPTTSESLRPVKKAVVYLIGDYNTKRKIILETQSIEKFFGQIKSIKPHLLASWHRSALETTNLSEMIYTAIMMEDVEVLGHLFKDSASVKEQTLIALLTSEFAKDSVKLQAFLVENGTAEELANGILTTLATKSVSHTESGRILVPGMKLMSGTNAKEVEFTALPLPEISSLSTKAILILDLIVSGIETRNDSLLETVFFKNEVFYTAFQVRGLKEELSKVPAFNAMERDVAIRKVDLLVTNFWEQAKKYVSAKVGKDEWKSFAKKIDAKKLGYEIK